MPDCLGVWLPVWFLSALIRLVSIGGRWSSSFEMLQCNISPSFTIITQSTSVSSMISLKSLNGPHIRRMSCKTWTSTRCVDWSVWLCLSGYLCLVMFVWISLSGYVCLDMFVWFCQLSDSTRTHHLPCQRFKRFHQRFKVVSKPSLRCSLKLMIRLPKVCLVVLSVWLCCLTVCVSGCGVCLVVLSDCLVVTL